MSKHLSSVNRKIVANISKSLDFFVKVLNYINGKGYGSSSVIREVQCIKKVLGKAAPKTLIDVGGNKGTYAEQLVKYFPNSEIHVFEPSATNIKVLTEKFSLNKNVKLNQAGLGNVTGQSSLYTNILGSGLGSLTKRRLEHHNINFDKSEQVDIIKFVDYYNANLKGKTIDLIKIDVEGHELDVLEGCAEVIDSIKCIQFEYGGCNIDTRSYFQDFWYFFKERNFDIYRISPMGLILMDKYSEQQEHFLTTNFICVNNSYI